MSTRRQYSMNERYGTFDQSQNSQEDFTIEESIYNLLPKEEDQFTTPVKRQKYTSKHPFDQAPTASTFGTKSTSIPKIANIGGEKIFQYGNHRFVAQSADFGQPKSVMNLSPENYLKKMSGIYSTIKTSKPGSIQDFKTESTIKRPKLRLKQELPSKYDAPIFGLKSLKNYILSNATTAILSVPKLPEIKKTYIEKKDFGKVPKYLEKIKRQISSEYDKIKLLNYNQELEKEKAKYQLEQEEIEKLKEGLQKKYNQIHGQYQLIAHKNNFNQIGLKKRKENYEKQLEGIEKDINFLHKKYIFIDTNN